MDYFTLAERRLAAAERALLAAPVRDVELLGQAAVVRAGIALQTDLPADSASGRRPRAGPRRPERVDSTLGGRPPPHPAAVRDQRTDRAGRNGGGLSRDATQPRSGSGDQSVAAGGRGGGRAIAASASSGRERQWRG